MSLAENIAQVNANIAAAARDKGAAALQQLQTDMEQLRSWLGGLGTLFGGG